MEYTACVNTEIDLLPALRRYWGYDSFRPLQERIVRSLLQKRDTCGVMPTGGGKSLCSQLPAALLSEQAVIVVSPLIALMQDQVAQLTQMGITAALLNSSVAATQQTEIMRQASKARYRLLYLSPERLARADTVEWLRNVPVSFFVIDEAHCISEWGHEFRPEYRQMNSLRANFPERPIAAFTASATQRVRHDIIDQLQLRDPHKYIASFHRPNLRYIIKECTGREQPNLLLKALRAYSEQNVIVYAPTINKVEETVDFLEQQGIPAIAYHGKMDNETRRENQERWMSDEVRVLVGTVAFGLGINKAAVRAVIHLSLPKSIEQYYQEAGRAGRDGLPADCVLLWQKKDVGLLTHFMQQLTDPQERERGWQRYHIIRNFVESAGCRHRQICLHFGESPKWATCGACDVCGCEIEWLNAPVPAPKSKRRGKSSRPSSVAHAQSFTAAASITFTRGLRPSQQNDLPVSASAAAASTPGSGWWGSAGKRKGSGASAKIASGVDPELREYMREWRRVVSNKMNIAAFIILP